MTISQVLVILLRRGWIVLLALLTTMIVAGGVLLFVPGRYEAVATASIDPGQRRSDYRDWGRLQRIGLADARQHPFAGFQRAGRARRGEAIEPDRQPAD